MQRHLQSLAFGLVIVAVVPYTVLKLVWLAGSEIGLKNAAAVAEAESSRMLVGNTVTIVLDLLAVALAYALIRPVGRKVPAWVVLLLAGAATGLLAPILLGLPLGMVVQLATSGNVRTSGMDNLEPWVFGLVYGGFALMAVALCVLLWLYVVDRWAGILAAPPRPPALWVVVAGALGLLPFGAGMLWWGLMGPGGGGPQAMDATAQRTVLVVTGILAVAAFLAPYATPRRESYSRAAWLVTWTGCAVAALQGPTQVLLANGGNPTPVMIVLALITTPGSCLYGWMVLRGRLAAGEGRGQSSTGVALAAEGGAH
ncbi:hypothetical protein J2S40_003698 [Nocardioides luteus]|uniref:DUF998 domain-containing protein n=1 Tax=Nocardioides luteus TaxID=1844 RepID=A0ABQ5SZ94_9ACTN|nr:hypothetical protein [Nocardioides luteus]MDR7312640.1 hypothetical protein [Nocardioides luteus]GGR46518.1 hypothetical protein GCM10010197_10240 [Nocardioides luteus]GLJ68888.1 hypothetical protein GCM10017579_29240 [Nocardioides luteus]